MFEQISPYLAIETTMEVEVRSYHTRMLLYEDNSFQMLSKTVNEDALDFEIAPVLKLFLRLPGVVAAKIEPYKLTIQRAPLFTWEEMEPAILDILKGVGLAIESTKQAEDARLPCRSQKPKSSGYAGQLVPERV